MDKAITYTYPIITQDLQTLLLDTPNAAHLSLRLLNVMYGDDFIELEYPEIPDGGSGQGGVPAPPSGPKDDESSSIGTSSISDKVTFFPNPSNSNITIRIHDDHHNSVIQMHLYDQQGRKIDSHFLKLSASEIQFDLSAYSNGIYYIQIVTQKGNTYLGKIIKQ